MTRPDYVREGESIEWLGRPTLAVLARHLFILAMLAAAASLFLFGTGSKDVGSRLVPALAILGFYVASTVVQAFRLRRAEYAITNEGVYTRTGVIGRTVTQTTYDKITDIALRQDILGRLLGYASLHVNTAGSNVAPLRLEGLRRAYDARALLEQHRDRYLRRDASSSAPRPALPSFVPDRLLARLTCPKTKRPYKRPRSENGTRAPCPHCGGAHIVRAGAPP